LVHRAAEKPLPFVVSLGWKHRDKGEIYIGDKMVNDLDPKQRNIAMVFQSYACTAYDRFQEHGVSR
jgi:ABC-type thiamine transport system ATPase subunit